MFFYLVKKFLCKSVGAQSSNGFMTANGFLILSSVMLEF